MNDNNKNTITYDEGWQSVTDAEYPHRISYDIDEFDQEYNSDEEINELPKKKKDAPKQLLITIQLVICLVAAFAAFALKSIGGEIYESAREWYYTNLNSSAVFDESRNFDFNSIFGVSTQDEAENT